MDVRTSAAVAAAASQRKPADLILCKSLACNVDSGKVVVSDWESSRVRYVLNRELSEPFLICAGP